MRIEKNERASATDVNSKWIAITGWGFAGLLVLLAGFLWLIYEPKLETWRENSGNYSIEAFPAPRLLVDPALALRELHEKENETLTTYSWADAGHTTAKVPIERALEIAARRGLVKTQPLSVLSPGGSDAQ